MKTFLKILGLIIVFPNLMGLLGNIALGFFEEGSVSQSEPWYIYYPFTYYNLMCSGLIILGLFLIYLGFKKSVKV